MNANNYFSKVVVVNEPVERVRLAIKSLSTIPDFKVSSENDLLNKYVFECLLVKKTEIAIKSLSETTTEVTIYALDRYDSYYKDCAIATNIATNVENALTLALEGKHSEFVRVDDKMDSGSCLVAIITVVAIAAALFLGIKSFV